MTSTYRTLSSPVQAQIEVKRSRFLCDLAPAADEEAARAVVEVARRRHWDARHHCSAFVLGPERDVRRSSDDGEPAGTAGMPMLDVLVGSGLSDVVAVVTRWFGGTLLGAGGLVKAYGAAVTQAVEQASIATYERCVLLTTALAVADVGRVENAVRHAGFSVESLDYTSRAAQAEVVLDVTVALDRRETADALLAELTSGTRQFRPSGHTWVPRS